MKRIIIGLLVCLLMFNLYACKETDEEQSTSSLQKFELNRINIDTYDSFVGYVCEKEKQSLVGEYKGLIVDEVKVIKGQMVKKGDVICTFNKEDLENRIIYLNKFLNGNIEGITDAEISLYGEDYLELESVSQVMTQIDKLKTLQATPYVKSECIGVVLDLNVEPGQRFTNNIIADIGIGKQIVVYVSDKQQYDYLRGMSARIFLKGQSERYIDGMVTEISNYKMEEGYPVYIDFESDNLFMGSKVGIQLITDSKEDVYAIPYYYLLQNEKGFYIINDKNKKIYVEVGLVTDYYVEIDADDVCQGDYIIKSEE